MSTSVEIQETEIPGVLEIRPHMFQDERGFFMEAYNRHTWAEAGFSHTFVQDNLSNSTKGVLRGMHYQLEPHGMGKLVRAISGSVYDVVVDLRRGSPAFGRWLGRELREDTPLWLYVPAGVAHGFLSLCDNTRVYYKCTHTFTAEADRVFRYNDPSVGIVWPEAPVRLSPKDAAAPMLADAEHNFTYERRP